MATTDAWDVLAKEIASLLAKHIPPANVHHLTRALHGLTKLAHQAIPPHQKEGFEMTSAAPDPTNPADQVSISQSWLEFVAQTISSTDSVLGPYIAQLVAGETVTIDPANVADVQTALAALQELAASAPAPTPDPTPVPDPTPAPDAPTS